MSGRVNLYQNSEISSVFCNQVNFPQYVFKPMSKVHVFLTFSWGDNNNKTVKGPAATWSEDLTSEGFTACALISGRILIGDRKNVSIYWTAMQKGSVEEHEGQTIGSVEFGTWYTGSRCQKLEMVSGFPFIFFILKCRFYICTTFNQ